jgi:enamine deaminase RidA (YjgF/YER057c/UK114 family)
MANTKVTSTIHDIGVAKQIGTYSDAVEIRNSSRQLYLSGQPGLAPDGQLPDSFEQQAEQAWKNVTALLEKAGMGIENLVKISTYLVTPEDIDRYGRIRAKYLGAHRPASMLVVVPQLVRKDLLVEVEAVAAAD